jgi:hypothetical protein
MTSRRTTFPVAIALCVTAAALSAQPLNRMKGKVLTEAGVPLEAEVRIEAVLGPRGEGYVGQRTFSIRSGAKGEWTLIGFKAGAWMFAVAPAGYLPDAIVLPINVLVPAGSSIAGAAPSWQPVLKAAPLPDGESGGWLQEGIAAALAGEAPRVSNVMREVPHSADAAALAAAGRICLLVRDAGLARTLFDRALELDPKSFRAKLGVASTALMVADFAAAGKAFKAARDLTSDKDERGYLTAAIADLSRMDISGH